jgi:hypothetical protein
MGIPASIKASVVALRSAARREPSCERTWREMLIEECGKRCVCKFEARALEMVISSS